MRAMVRSDHAPWVEVTMFAAPFRGYRQHESDRSLLPGRFGPSRAERRKDLVGVFAHYLATDVAHLGRPCFIRVPPQPRGTG